MLTNILIKPSITEKSLILAQKGQFTFYVNKSATKAAISSETEAMFKVNVLKIRLVNRPGKPKRTGKKRLATKTKSRRLAIITLKPGQSIDYFKLPDEKTPKSKKAKLPKKTDQPLTSTSKAKPRKKGFLGLSSRKEQRTQDK